MSERKADAPNPGIWTVVLASSAGTIIEWYDFYLYGSLAVFFSTLFYPANDPTAAVLISVATFATGFVIRPFGAILFGSLGDRLGRKHTFLLTLILMGIATTAVGLLPTYASIGFAAPVALVRPHGQHAPAAAAGGEVVPQEEQRGQEAGGGRHQGVQVQQGRASHQAHR